MTETELMGMIIAQTSGDKVPVTAKPSPNDIIDHGDGEADNKSVRLLRRANSSTPVEL